MNKTIKKEERYEAPTMKKCVMTIHNVIATSIGTTEKYEEDENVYDL